MSGTSRLDDRERCAFTEQAYLEHGDAVFALASGMCGPANAAEVTHDVFVRVGRTASRFDRTRPSLRTYLLTLCGVRAVEAMRLDEVSDVPDDSRSDGLALLDGLPPDEREAMVLMLCGDWTYRQAATLLGESDVMVRSSVRRGLLRLRGLTDAQVDGPSTAE